MEDVYEIFDYLPIDDLEVSDYVNPLFNSAQVTYDKEEYQFSYFAIHLIFMTIIYSTVWKISQFHSEHYEKSLLFARPYENKKIDLKKIKTIFEFSYLPEKDIFEFFQLIGIDNGYIKSTKRLIDYRNEMAHATGKIQINSREKFDAAISEIVSVTRKIHESLSLTIRDYYNSILIGFAKDSLPEKHETPHDYIYEVLINNLSFSKKDFQTCKDFGINKLKNWKISGLSKEEIIKVVEFHSATCAYYIDTFGKE